jgi:hypothetical protein
MKSLSQKGILATTQSNSFCFHCARIFKPTRGSFLEQTFCISACYLFLLRTSPFLLGTCFTGTFTEEKMSKTKEERRDTERGWLGRRAGEAGMKNPCSCLF